MSAAVEQVGCDYLTATAVMFMAWVIWTGIALAQFNQYPTSYYARRYVAVRQLLRYVLAWPVVLPWTGFKAVREADRRARAEVAR